MKLANLALPLASLCLVLAPPVRADEPAAVKMNLIATDAMPKLGGYRPQLLQLSDKKPDGLIKKAPELAAPLYGELKFGGKSYLVVVDEPEGKDSRLLVDANGNGDLTDDPATTWNKTPYKSQAGDELTRYMGDFKLPLSTGDKPTLVSLSTYRFDKKDALRGSLKTVLLYYSNYAFEGQITLGTESYRAMLADDFASGDFSGKGDDPAQGPRVRLLIDRDGDGRFARGETFDAAQPFNVGGTSYVLADMTAGGSFKIAKSDKQVEEIAMPPSYAVGKPVLAFTATGTDGKPVNFPGDYKGKVVMLDFWATWCGPCMGEVPNLVKAYNEYHPKGLEILGISLDQPNAADKVKSVTAETGMTWRQVYDGKFWQAEIAQKYGIDAIPAAFLVDGDTGMILAKGDELRGEGFAKQFKAALEGKAAKAKEAKAMN